MFNYINVIKFITKLNLTFRYKKSPDGPVSVIITREDVPKEEETIYNMCPDRTDINLICDSGGVYPGAKFTMMSIPEGVVVVNCEDVADNCSYSFFPTVTGGLFFNCTANNIVFDNLVNETTLNITVQGKIS